MKLISHRGLINGPDQLQENNPNKILETLNLGYDCEIDFRIIDHKFYLGHDDPTYQIDSSFIYMSGLWIHAKNLCALKWLLTTNLNYFWHQEDDFTLTSNKFIWTYPGKELTENSIMVMPEWNDPNFNNLNRNCYGICSDYVEIIKLKFYS